MVFSPQSSTGQHALDEVQTHSAQIGYGWKSGLAASLTGSSTAIESQWTAGSVLWDGETIDIPSGTITHDAGDATNPRWDALAVTDSSGTIQIVKGTPAPVATDDNGTEYPGEQAWTPSPSDQITRDMVVFAIVWIPANASDNTDLTNTSAGGVNNPVVDRRMETPGRDEQVTRSATITSSGWYRIASVGPVQDGVQGTDVRASALFSVRDTRQTLHSENIFRAQQFFDRNPTLALTSSSYYTGTHGAITDIRLVHSPDTYEGAAVECNVQLQGQAQVPVSYTISHNYIMQGWNPEPWAAGSIPTGFNTTEIDLSRDPLLSYAADGVNDLFSVLRDGEVTTAYASQQEKAASIDLSTDTSIAAAGTQIPFDTINTDDWGAWDTGTGEFTAPRDGWYSVDASVRWNDFADKDRLDLQIRRNGNTQTISRELPGAGKVVTQSSEKTMSLSQGDVIAVYGLHDAGSSRTVQGSAAETYCTVVYEG